MSFYVTNFYAISTQTWSILTFSCFVHFALFRVASVMNRRQAKVLISSPKGAGIEGLI